MTGLNLLGKVGYVSGALFGLFTAEKGQVYLEAWTQWATIHQLLCLIGGFLWLAATVSYTRSSTNASLYCGRQDRPEAWTSPNKAARWGRIAGYLAIVAPVFYAVTRYAWALGIPLGMSEEQFRRGQESGSWIAGLSLTTFCLVGAILILGLVQRWGEVFPRWMIGQAGRRVSIALAVVPASLASVLLIVVGIGIWPGLPQMVANLVAGGVKGIRIVGAIIFQVGPTLLFPVWGVALAVATLGYYYRWRCGAWIRARKSRTWVDLAATIPPMLSSPRVVRTWLQTLRTDYSCGKFPMGARCRTISSNGMAVTFSLDGRYLAYSDVENGNKVILDSPDGARVIRTLEGMQSPVWELFFSPDASLLTATDSREIHVWRVEDGALLFIEKTASP